MSTALAKPIQRVRWTVKDYLRMGNAGLFDDRRVELINGEVVEMASQAHPHRTSVTKSSRALLNAFGAGSSWVVIQGTLLLPPHGAPDPDFHVFDVPVGTPDAKLPLPLLVIEIADTTYLRDAGPKLRMYARAGILDYWIINLPKERIEIYRRPENPTASPSGRWRYGQTNSFGRGERVSPLARPDLSFAVDDMLP